MATAPGTPADETAILTRGPDIMALGEYFSAMDSVTGDLERMYKGLVDGRGGAREAGVKDLSRLVEIGLEGLVGLALRLVGEGSGGRWMNVEDLLNTGEYQVIHRTSMICLEGVVLETGDDMLFCDVLGTTSKENGTTRTENALTGKQRLRRGLCSLRG